LLQAGSNTLPWILGITIIICPPYHLNTKAYPLNSLPSSRYTPYLLKPIPWQTSPTVR
jgi:hypothetical protein